MPAVTPADAGAMAIVEETLRGLGFVCRRMKFGEIENLYARYGTTATAQLIAKLKAKARNSHF